jgi:hypothetical protein
MRNWTFTDKTRHWMMRRTPAWSATDERLPHYTLR